MGVRACDAGCSGARVPVPPPLDVGPYRVLLAHIAVHQRRVCAMQRGCRLQPCGRQAAKILHAVGKASSGSGPPVGKRVGPGQHDAELCPLGGAAAPAACRTHTCSVMGSPRYPTGVVLTLYTPWRSTCGPSTAVTSQASPPRLLLPCSPRMPAAGAARGGQGAAGKTPSPCVFMRWNAHAPPPGAPA